MSHTYEVVLETKTLVTVYNAESKEDAEQQAREMVEALDDRESQHDMNHGHVWFLLPTDASATVEHDSQCLCEDDDE
jgi:hypothetical protein